MPYGAPVSVPSARVDLTKFALKNLTLFAGVGVAGDGNPNLFLHGYRNSLLTDLADRVGPGFNRNVYQSLDNGATWAVFHTVGVSSMPQAMCFQWNALGNNLNIILAHGTTGGDSGIDFYNGSTGVWSTLRIATGVTVVSDVQTADPKNFGMNADGTTFNATMIAVGNGGSIWRSTDGGFNWVARVSGTGTSLNSVYSNGNGLWIARGAGVICRSTDDGLTWTALTPTIIPDKICFANGRFFGPRNAGDGQFLSSVNGIDFGVDLILSGQAVHCCATDQNGIAMIGGDRGTVHLTRDYLNFQSLQLGNQPALVTVPLAGNIRIRTLSFDGSYQSNVLSTNRWLLSATNSAATTDNPLLGSLGNIPDAA